ncbi:hypothetical protein OTU49_012010, partial [Cherax quadricarinatus]
MNQLLTHCAAQLSPRPGALRAIMNQLLTHCAAQLSSRPGALRAIMNQLLTHCAAQLSPRPGALRAIMNQLLTHCAAQSSHRPGALRAIMNQLLTHCAAQSSHRPGAIKAAEALKVKMSDVPMLKYVVLGPGDLDDLMTLLAKHYFSRENTKCHDLGEERECQMAAGVMTSLYSQKLCSDLGYEDCATFHLNTVKETLLDLSTLNTTKFKIMTKYLSTKYKFTYK